jgi:hypothetical protein
MAYIYQAKTGKWGYNVSLGIDPVTGKQRQKTKSAFKTEKEAIRAAVLLEKQFEDGELKTEAKLKVSAFLPEFLTWYGHHAKKKQCPSSPDCIRESNGAMARYTAPTNYKENLPGSAS